MKYYLMGLLLLTVFCISSCRDYPMNCGEDSMGEYLLESKENLPELGDFKYLRIAKEGRFDTLFFKLLRIDTIINRYRFNNELKIDDDYECYILVESQRYIYEDNKDIGLTVLINANYYPVYTFIISADIGRVKVNEIDGLYKRNIEWVENRGIGYDARFQIDSGMTNIITWADSTQLKILP